MNVGIFEDDATFYFEDEHDMKCLENCDSDVNGWRVGDSCFD